MAAGGVTLRSGWATDKGRKRTENEDALLVAPELGIWAVADGMGGHASGQLASSTIVEELGRIRPAHTAMELREQSEQAVATANARLLAFAEANGGEIVGSTLALLLVFDSHYACLWAGDSRIYVVRGGAIRALTRDHTELEQLISQGVLSPEEAKRWPHRNVITRAIGIAPEPDLELASGTIAGGDAFVLCSDGLTAYVPPEEIAAIVSSSGPQEACDRLVQLTLERGAADNVTVIVAVARDTTVIDPAPQPSTTWGRSDGG